jgi:hypothetical protein
MYNKSWCPHASILWNLSFSGLFDDDWDVRGSRNKLHSNSKKLLMESEDKLEFVYRISVMLP